MNHKEMTKYIREYLKVMEIPCRIQMSLCCGVKYISVKPINVDTDFSAQSSFIIKTLACGLNLTHTNGLSIIVENHNSRDHVFEVA